MCLAAVREATKDTGQGDSTPAVVTPTPLDLQNPPGIASKHSWTSKTFLEFSLNGPGHSKSSSGSLQAPLNLQNPPEGLSKPSWTSKIHLGVPPNSLITLTREQLALWERSLRLHIRTGVQEQQQREKNPPVGNEGKNPPWKRGGKKTPWERRRKKSSCGKEEEKSTVEKREKKFTVEKREEKRPHGKDGGKKTPVEKRRKNSPVEKRE